MYIKSIRMYAECRALFHKSAQIVDKSIDKLGAHMHIYEAIDKIPEIL